MTGIDTGWEPHHHWRNSVKLRLSIIIKSFYHRWHRSTEHNWESVSSPFTTTSVDVDTGLTESKKRWPQSGDHPVTLFTISRLDSSFTLSEHIHPLRVIKFFFVYWYMITDCTICVLSTRYTSRTSRVMSHTIVLWIHGTDGTYQFFFPKNISLSLTHSLTNTVSLSPSLPFSAKINHTTT